MELTKFEQAKAIESRIKSLTIYKEYLSSCKLNTPFQIGFEVKIGRGSVTNLNVGVGDEQAHQRINEASDYDYFIECTEKRIESLKFEFESL